MAIAIVQTLPQLMAVREISSLGLGVLWPTAFSLLGDLFERKERGRAAGIMTAVSFSGTIVSFGVLPLLATESTLKGTLINIAAFVVLSIPFLFYFTVDNLWVSWKTDLILGVVAGILLTLVQSTAWEGPKSRILPHGLAMAISFPLIMVGIRYSLTIDTWLLMLLAGTLITFLASAVIVLIDNQSILKEDTDPTP